MKKTIFNVIRTNLFKSNFRTILKLSLNLFDPKFGVEVNLIREIRMNASLVFQFDVLFGIYMNVYFITNFIQ